MESREVTVRLRMSAQEYETAMDKAEKSRLPLSRYMRELIAKDQEQVKPSQPLLQPFTGNRVDPRILERDLHALIRHAEMQTDMKGPMPTATDSLVDKCVETVCVLTMCNGNFPQLTRAAYMVYRRRVSLSCRPQSQPRQCALDKADAVLREKINMCLRFSRDRRVREARDRDRGQARDE